MMPAFEPKQSISRCPRCRKMGLRATVGACVRCRAEEALAESLAKKRERVRRQAVVSTKWNWDER